MRLLKHLLWIIPLVLAGVIFSMSVSTANARENDVRYHSNLPKSLQVRSNNFLDREDMPTEYSCFGQGGSPHIRWQNVPLARSYAIIVMDWDAPMPSLRLFPVVHWVVYNIPRKVFEIPAKARPQQVEKMGATIGMNVSGKAAFAEPCPQLGRHEYVFRVYALNVDKIQPETNDREGVLRAMEGHILTFGELIGAFGG
jgi:Raf kinase inhibitor-like YbhB/YbcL family protein